MATSQKPIDSGFSAAGFAPSALTRCAVLTALAFPLSTLFTRNSIAVAGAGLRCLQEPARVIPVLIAAWTIALPLLLSSLVFDKPSLGSFGLKKISLIDLALAILGFIINYYLVFWSYGLIAQTGLRMISIDFGRASTRLRWAVLLTGGIAEEFIFRGYLIERVVSWTGRISVAVICSCIVFFLWHVPLWGIGSAICIGVSSSVFALLYGWRRNLPACMLMHGLCDAYGLALVPAFQTPGRDLIKRFYITGL